MTTLARAVLRLSLGLSLVGAFRAAATPLTFQGTGTGTGGVAIGARVTFDFVTYNFGSGPVNAVEIRLRNTAAVTTVRGNLVTGVFFSIVNDAVGDLSTTLFDGQAASVTQANGTTLTNVDIAPAVANGPTDGGYQLSNGPFGLSNGGVSYAAFQYGISTTGGGLSGFSGQAVNGDDYGIYAAGSSVSSGGLASARPLIDTEAVFWVFRPAAWISLDQIEAVRVSYGSLPDNQIFVTNSVPEPSTLALTLAAGVVMWRRQRASRK